MYDLYSFYRSDVWEALRKVIINERVQEDGFVHDEITGEPIVKPYDIILHHKIPLTEENVNDATIALNPENIEIVSFRTHNQIHGRFCGNEREVFLVYGSPLSGKTTFVRENMSEGDLIVDIDNIWECVSGMPKGHKPKRLNAVVFQIRDALIEDVKYRLGKWHTAYVVGGYPLKAERERLCKELGAKEVFIDTSRDECIARIDESLGEKMKIVSFIDEWWERYSKE